MASLASRLAEVVGRARGDKLVTCTHCGHVSEVARRAMSIFCPKCRKRLILEDFKIDSYYAVRDFSTSGNIVVEKKGHVVAPIKVGNLTVKGKVQGQITAQGEVKLTKTGCIRGEIAARSINIEEGGVLDAFVRIGSIPADPEVTGPSDAGGLSNPPLALGDVSLSIGS